MLSDGEMMKFDGVGRKAMFDDIKLFGKSALIGSMSTTLRLTPPLPRPLMAEILLVWR